MPVAGTPCPKPVRSPKAKARRGKQQAYAQETNLAKTLTSAGMPAKRVFMSGAAKGIGQDGDVEAGNLTLGLIAECKMRTPDVSPRGAKHISLDLGWLVKVEAEAALHGKPGVLVIHPHGADYADDLVVVRRSVMIDRVLGPAYRALTGETLA